MKVKRENHQRLKAILLSIAVILGPVAPWILLNAEDWFELTKGLIVIVVVVGIVWIYAHLELKEEELPQDRQPPQVKIKSKAELLKEAMEEERLQDPQV